MEGQPLLEVTNLSKSFRGLQAVRDVTLSIPQGSFFGIIGPNGAGKSTLLNCVSGMITSYQGTVHFGGQDISRKRLHAVASLGLIRSFQVSRLFSQLSVLSNLMVAPPNQKGEGFWSACFGGWREGQKGHLEAARGLLDRYGIDHLENDAAFSLSGGQRRLVELARSIMAQPRAILLDEPFAGVSPSNRTLLAEQLRALCEEGGVTIVMIEHRLEMIESLCQRVAVMAEGRVIAQGSMESLRADPAVIRAYLGGGAADAP